MNIHEINWTNTLVISESDFNSRKSTCISCDKFVAETLKCQLCGCPTTNFWMTPESSCPAGKFNAVIEVAPNTNGPNEGVSTLVQRDVKPA